MFTRKYFPIFLIISFVLALVVSIIFLTPSGPQTADQILEVERPQAQPSKVQEEKIESSAKKVPQQEKPEPRVATNSKTLSAALQAVKDGKNSVISTIFEADDLNAQVNELLALSEQGEAWADFAIGQVVEMCGYLHETPESQLIAMFTSSGRTVNAAIQDQMSQLLPVVLDASQRCKTMDGKQLKEMGSSRDWFEKAAEANQPSAFVTTGYSLINKRLRQEIEMSPDATDADVQNSFENVRDRAKAEYHAKIREHFEQGRVNPETLMSMSEHLNLFYEGDHPYKRKEAWMLMACDQGYEQGCNQGSKMMSLYCMFDNSCKSGGNFQEGIVWEQGQFKYDEYRRIADELRLIIDTKDWDKLGF